MTTYIESRPLPDGTYDHTEVRAAENSGAIVQYSDFKGDWWPAYGLLFWISSIKYRAQVPDTYDTNLYPDKGRQEDQRLFNTIALREVKGDAGPAVAEMLLDRIKELEQALTDIVRDHEDPLEPGTTQYFWDKARAALNKEPK